MGGDQGQGPRGGQAGRPFLPSCLTFGVMAPEHAGRSGGRGGRTGPPGYPRSGRAYGRTGGRAVRSSLGYPVLYPPPSSSIRVTEYERGADTSLRVYPFPRTYFLFGCSRAITRSIRVLRAQSSWLGMFRIPLQSSVDSSFPFAPPPLHV